MVVAPSELKSLSVEELMDIEVTSVSKQPEKLSETASAIQVITGEEIRRSGALSLPDALRLAPNLQVAQLNSYAWITSARGFNAVFSNKLLVMIDGRSVYTPLFGGVFWDVQNVLLEDIDRIEVVSGPGGTLWGANAVNGVINIITKSAQDSQGIYASAGGGTFLKRWGAVRYGGQLGSDLFFRLYAQRYDHNNTFLTDGQDASDEWAITTGGFRLDWQPSDVNTLTVQGDLYDGAEQTSPSESPFDGQNVLGRFTHTFSAASDISVQGYVDHTWRRDIPSTITDELTTYDVDVQYRFPLGERHRMLGGVGYRLMQNEMGHSTEFAGFLPPRRTMQRFSGFVQDAITLVDQRLEATIGTKLEHNDFAGFEVQPSVRVAWTPDGQQTVWSAVSRAIRSPSRIDVDYYIPTFSVPPDEPSVAGGPNFDSEKAIALELGYRLVPTSSLSLSLAVFHNRYDDLYSVEALPGTQTYQIQNGTEGHASGAELSGTYQLLRGWRVRGGYTYFYKDLVSAPAYDPADLGHDPRHRLLLHSMVDLPAHFQFDLTTGYVGTLADLEVPHYIALNTRLAWQFKYWELAVIGRNLWNDRHPEFGSLEIPRSIFGKVTWRY